MQQCHTTSSTFGASNPFRPVNILKWVGGFESIFGLCYHPLAEFLQVLFKKPPWRRLWRNSITVCGFSPKYYQQPVVSSQPICSCFFPTGVWRFSFERIREQHFLQIFSFPNTQQHSQDSRLSLLGKDVLPLIRDQVLQKELGLGCLSGDACRFLPGLVSELPPLPAPSLWPWALYMLHSCPSSISISCLGGGCALQGSRSWTFSIMQCSRIDFHAAGRQQLGPVVGSVKLYIKLLFLLFRQEGERKSRER